MNFYNPKRFTREDAVKHTKNGVLDIPEGVTTLDCDFAFFVVREDLPRVHKLIIPKSVSLIETMRGDCSEGPYGYMNNPFSEIVVNPENEHYISYDGILFRKDMKELICYPCGKTDKRYRIPDGVEIIAGEAFLNVEHLTAVSFPDSLACIEQGAFSGCALLDFPDIVTIYKYEKKMLITFPEIREDDYHKETENFSTLLTGQSLERMSEAELANIESTQLELVSDYCSRQKVLQQLWTILEDIDWIIEHEELSECLNRFRAIFYSDY